MEVYNSVLKFHMAIYTSLWMLVFPYILYCGGQGCPPQMRKTMIFNVYYNYLMTYMSNLFENFKGVL